MFNPTLDDIAQEAEMNASMNKEALMEDDIEAWTSFCDTLQAEMDAEEALSNPCNASYGDF